MKLPRRLKKDLTLTFGSIFFLLFILPWAFCQIFPTWSFRLITGRKIPPNVVVLDYESRFTDNFFYRSSFWLLQGSAGDLGKVGDGGLFRVWGKAPFLPQDEAPWSLPDTEDLFGLNRPKESLTTVYFEGESGIRSRCYWVLGKENKAIFRQ